jgi:two-component system, LuxR family, sensor kinase FixL
MLLAAGYIALYLALDWASYVQPVRHTGVTAWNPNTGLLMALLLTRGERWAVLAAIGCFLGDFLIDDAPVPWRTTVFTALYVTTVYTLAAWLLRQRGFGRAIETPAGAAWFVGVTLVAAGTAATGYVYILLSAAQLEPGDALGSISRYWIGEFNGIIAVTPVMLLRLDLAGLRERIRRNPREFVLQCVGMAAGVVLAFALAAARDVRMFYPLFLPVTWIALRYGVVGAMISVTLAQAAMVAALELTPGSIALFDVQFPLLLLGVTALFLGALATQRNQVVEQMREQDAALQGALRSAVTGQLASALAHEINQPLTALLSYLRAARMLTEAVKPADERVAAALQKADVEAIRASSVLRRLRDSYRGEGVDPEKLDVGSVCERVVDALRDRIRVSRVEVQVSSTAGLPAVVADRMQLEIVVHNLLSNAIDALNTIPATKDNPRQIEISAHAGEGDVRISVEDSGPGVAASVAARLFQPLNTSKVSGMGLGLALSRSLLRSQGADLWLENGGRLSGARFVVRLPLQPITQSSL